ncbi:MAG: hypothetical protein ABH844_01465 [Candidatus Omnitrophota bacterium]
MDRYFQFYKERIITGLVIWGIIGVIYLMKEVALCVVRYIQGLVQIIR